MNPVDHQLDRLHHDRCERSIDLPRLHASRLVAAPTAVTTRRQLNLRRIPASAALYRETRRFYAFKAGDLSHTPVYALRIARALRTGGAVDFDAVVPVPLSPDRAAAGASHRTLALARALSRALGAPALELLRLAAPITKHGDLPSDPTPRDIAAWEFRYAAALRAAPAAARLRRILVVDDAVCRGATLARCLDALPAGTARGAAAVHFTPPHTRPGARPAHPRSPVDRHAPKALPGHRSPTPQEPAR